MLAPRLCRKVCKKRGVSGDHLWDYKYVVVALGHLVEVEVMEVKVVKVVEEKAVGERWTTHQRFGLRCGVAHEGHHLEVGRDAAGA